ncbi:MAG: hypothetical protein PWP21_354 [Thermosediminibacterales bacterium]|nr:hypothetical protein [Thermosediminibacterales bacterium]
MKAKEDLRSLLKKIDGKGYKLYKEIQGIYDFGEGLIINIDYVQGDPFAAPSKVCARLTQKKAKFPEELYNTKSRKVAAEDFVTRKFAENIDIIIKGNRGTGKSGLISIDRGGQEVLERTSVVINKEYVEARFVIGLPAKGRKILGKQAEEMFFEEIPKIVNSSMVYNNIDSRLMRKWVELYEDQEFIRKEMIKKGLIAFIANDSILPRKSGVSDLPMSKEKAIPFKSPPSLEVEFNTPNNGIVKGMGIPKGITLIVGGGYHGKSTLLKAIERGVYNHILGDGREFVLSDRDSVKIRAEDGRRVCRVDISPFINNLPYKQDTKAFSTDDASGSTSQAANIIEALEMGAKVLLMDEDTSATNFMIRDVRMQHLVFKNKEPITPFIDKVKLLKRDLDVSTILVLGGSGDYFDVADLVIMMDEYLPKNVTERAIELRNKYKTLRVSEGGDSFGKVNDRVVSSQGLNPVINHKLKIDAKSTYNIRFGNENINLNYVEQLVDKSQTNAIAYIIFYAFKNYINDNNSLHTIVKNVFNDIEKKGLDVISPFKGAYPGNFAMPRKYEVAAAINRLRSLVIKEQRWKA